MATKCYAVGACTMCPMHVRTTGDKRFCEIAERAVPNDAEIPDWCPLPDANPKAEEPKINPDKEQRIRAGDPGDARWQPAPGTIPVQEKPVEKPPVVAPDDTEVAPPDRASPRDLPKEPLEAPPTSDKPV